MKLRFIDTDNPCVELALLDLALLDAAEGAAERFLTPAERAEYARLRHPKRRREWLGARVCVKTLAVRRYGLDDPRDCEIQKDQRGRPQLTFAPGAVTHTGDDCSLAHSCGFACACLGRAPGARVGVDIEPISPRPLKLANLFVADGDAPRERSRETQLTVLWCVKEASSKALGLGLGAGLSNIVCVEAAEGRHDVTIDGGTRLDAWHFLHEQHVIALSLMLPKGGWIDGMIGQPSTASKEHDSWPIAC